MVTSCTILLVIFYLMALAQATTYTDQHNRDLQVEDWHIALSAVDGQSLDLDVGNGGGHSPGVVVLLYDSCPSTTSGSPNLQGEFYPTNTVAVIKSGAATSVNLGTTSTLAWAFAEGIQQNAYLFTATGSNTALVHFCLQIGLYDDATLVSYLEVDLSYTMDMTEAYSGTSGFSKTAAENNVSDNVNLGNDGALLAYFCKPTTHEQLVDDSSIDSQGTTLDVCFRMVGGQFQVESVYDLTIVNDVGGNTPEQHVIVNGVLTDPGSSLIDCTSPDKTCVVSFKPANFFFDFSAITLAGSGNVLVQLGTRRRYQRHLLRGGQSRQQQDDEEDTPMPFVFQSRRRELTGQRFVVEATEFEVVIGSDPYQSSSYSCQTPHHLWKTAILMITLVFILVR